MSKISAKGLRWSAGRINHVPRGSGVVIVFNEEKKTFSAHTTDNMAQTLRAEWWKRNFWYFSWFVTEPPEHHVELKTKLEIMTFEELMDFTGDEV